jgi:hypothetical protein
MYRFWTMLAWFSGLVIVWFSGSVLVAQNEFYSQYQVQVQFLWHKICFHVLSLQVVLAGRNCFVRYTVFPRFIQFMSENCNTTLGQFNLHFSVHTISGLYSLCLKKAVQAFIDKIHTSYNTYTLKATTVQDHLYRFFSFA